MSAAETARLKVISIARNLSEHHATEARRILIPYTLAHLAEALVELDQAETLEEAALAEKWTAAQAMVAALGKLARR